MAELKRLKSVKFGGFARSEPVADFIFQHKVLA